jgi:4,5-DOPA dioxygenase extradiol
MPSRRALLGLAALAPIACNRRKFGTSPMSTPQPKTPRMPVLFVGHGSPMNAIEDNTWSRAFRALGVALPRPRAILCVSAHWFLPGTHLTASDPPETIHDFGGFPQALFDMQYPARGDGALARRVVQLLGEGRASLRDDWGLDHGTWSVLHHLRPAADCPVVQLSIDSRALPSAHLAIGQALRPLRDEGILVMGTGNVTHNLRHAMRNYQTGDRTTPPWAAAFDADVARAAAQHDAQFFTRALDSDAGRMSHPTVDHYLPLVYAVGASDERDQVSFPITGFDAGSLSMRAVQFG